MQSFDDDPVECGDIAGDTVGVLDRGDGVPYRECAHAGFSIAVHKVLRVKGVRIVRAFVDQHLYF